jgi:ER-bound oxygenase mpaB/B'/Rubber oxygenase, catalytic domain
MPPEPEVLAATANARAPSLPPPVYDPAAMRYHADPLADATMAEIVGTWALPAGETHLPTLLALNVERLQHLTAATQLLSTWTSNAAIVNWSPPAGSTAAPHVVSALRRYLDAGRALPAWADANKIAVGENVFTGHGPLAVMSLFCASLPDCYIQPKASAVLTISGQLTTNADYRIRSTAAMVFPVMLRGGLTTGEGIGIAQTLKVRLIHATIRNLILHGAPEAMVNAIIPPLSNPTPNGPLMAGTTPMLPMHAAFLANGWNVARDGIPNNQEQLVFTLLTFHFVFLRALRTLGIGLPAAQEEAYLHCWNVVGYVLGIEERWMPSTYADAEKLFLDIQNTCLADPVFPGGTDARPALTGALIDYMAASIPLKLLKPFPSLFTRYLCGTTVSNALGVSDKQSLLSRILFALCMGIVRVIDTVVRIFVPQFSLSRMFSRVVGYHLLTTFLMDQTRPLKLPTHLLNQIEATIGTWDDDPKAPSWLNRLEDRMTVGGAWHGKAR